MPICMSCKRVAKKLFPCPTCGAQVCKECLENNHCKLCHGRVEFKAK